jgi:hypothetical protein
VTPYIRAPIYYDKTKKGKNERLHYDKTKKGKNYKTKKGKNERLYYDETKKGKNYTQQNQERIVLRDYKGIL